MKRLRTLKSIEKEFKFEPLAKTSDFDKFMYKVYLKVKLRGGKLFSSLFGYSVGKCMNNHVEMIKERHTQLKELIKKIIKQGFWEIEDTDVYDYSADGKIIEWSEIRNKEPIVAATKTVVTTKRYYLTKPPEFYKFDGIKGTWEIEEHNLDKALPDSGKTLLM